MVYLEPHFGHDVIYKTHAFGTGGVKDCNLTLGDRVAFLSLEQVGHSDFGKSLNVTVSPTGDLEDHVQSF